MSTLYFRSLKYNSTINCSFHVKDGTEYVHKSDCRVGDTVHLMFNLSDEQAREIRKLERENFQPYRSGVSNERWGIIMRFRVSERRHTFNWREVGVLQTFGSDIGSFHLRVETP